MPYLQGNLPISEIQCYKTNGQNLIRDENYLIDPSKGADLMPIRYLKTARESPPTWLLAQYGKKKLLHRSKIGQARGQARDIINSSHMIYWDISAVFDPNNEYNVENILEIGFCSRL